MKSDRLENMVTHFGCEKLSCLFTHARAHADTEQIIIIVTEKGGQKPEEIKLEYIKFRLCCQLVWVARILVFPSLHDWYELRW